MRSRFIWRAYKARFRDQRAELAAIQQCVTSSDLVCDIGANKGSYMYWLSRWAGKVVAFEPQPGLAGYLKEASDKLGLRNVKIETAGVSATSGSADLYVPAPNSPGASLVPADGVTTIPVKTVALDDYFAVSEKVSLIKVDVEGAELDVFRGAQRILRENRPVLVFECEQRHLQNSTVTDCLNLLHDLGYRGQFVRRHVAYPAEDFDPIEHQRGGEGDFWNSPDYCNNFIFRPLAAPVEAKRPQKAHA